MLVFDDKIMDCKYISALQLPKNEVQFKSLEITTVNENQKYDLSTHYDLVAKQIEILLLKFQKLSQKSFTDISISYRTFTKCKNIITRTRCNSH